MPMKSRFSGLLLCLGRMALFDWAKGEAEQLRKRCRI